eukprot:GHVN01059830.1.p1 GENE.GHVN01059830.1~~GHVN01059830.1.p1  ORF type:complete len:523 (-),score=101.04 GHVN01059830.1:302-1870(-)
MKAEAATEWVNSERILDAMSLNPCPPFWFSNMVNAHRLQVVNTFDQITEYREPCVVLTPHTSLCLGPIQPTSPMGLIRRWQSDPRHLMLLVDPQYAVVSERLVEQMKTLAMGDDGGGSKQQEFKMRVLRCTLDLCIKPCDMLTIVNKLKPGQVLAPRRTKHRLANEVIAIQRHAETPSPTPELKMKGGDEPSVKVKRGASALFDDDDNEDVSKVKTITEERHVSRGSLNGSPKATGTAAGGRNESGAVDKSQYAGGDGDRCVLMSASEVSDAIQRFAYMAPCDVVTLQGMGLKNTPFQSAVLSAQFLQPCSNQIKVVPVPVTKGWAFKHGVTSVAVSPLSGIASLTPDYHSVTLSPSPNHPSEPQEPPTGVSDEVRKGHKRTHSDDDEEGEVEGGDSSIGVTPSVVNSGSESHPRLVLGHLTPSMVVSGLIKQGITDGRWYTVLRGGDVTVMDGGGGVGKADGEKLSFTPPKEVACVMIPSLNASVYLLSPHETEIETGDPATRKRVGEVIRSLLVEVNVAK